MVLCDSWATNLWTEGINMEYSHSVLVTLVRDTTLGVVLPASFPNHEIFLFLDACAVLPLSLDLSTLSQ